LAGKVKSNFKLISEVIMRTDKEKNFKVLPNRWIVERTLAWLVSDRKLIKDFEYQNDTAEAMIQ